MMDFARTTRRSRNISLVPLINVVFLLVLFFLIAGHMEKFSIISVELPVADSGQLLDEGPIKVVLGRYDEILVNDELFELSTLATELRKQLAHNPERVITIKADAALEANKLVGFMEQVRAAGGRNISLVTQAGTLGVAQ